MFSRFFHAAACICPHFLNCRMMPHSTDMPHDLSTVGWGWDGNRRADRRGVRMPKSLPSVPRLCYIVSQTNRKIRMASICETKKVRFRTHIILLNYLEMNYRSKCMKQETIHWVCNVGGDLFNLGEETSGHN